MSSSRICQLCEDPHLPSYYCEDCEEDMCEIMKIAHLKSKATRNHRLLPLNSEDFIETTITTATTARMKKTAASAGKTGICSMHGDEYRYYDEICCTRICRDCFALNHYGHRCISIEEGMNEKKRLCEEKYTTRILLGQDSYQKVVKEAERKKSEIDQAYMEVKTQIRTDFQRVLQAVEARQEYLLNQIEYFYSKYASNYASEQEPLQTILNEYERGINEFKDILLIDPPKGKEADIREINQLFEQFEALLGKEIILETKRLSSSKILQDCVSNAKFSYLLDDTELEKVVESIGKIGEVTEGETSAVHSVGEGEGLQKYENKDAEFVVTAYYGNGMKKTIGGDVISLILGERDEKGKELAEFERSVQANVTDEKNGVYRVKWRSMSAGLEGKIALHVKLNGKEIKGSPFNVDFNSSPTEGVYLSLGAFYTVSVDGKKASALTTADVTQAWCQINPIPLNKKFSFRVTPGTNKWFTLHFHEVEETNLGIGSSAAGKFAWNCREGDFAVNGSNVANKKREPTHKISLELTSDKLFCYSNDELHHTFSVCNHPYKLIIDTYWPNSSVELVP